MPKIVTSEFLYTEMGLYDNNDPKLPEVSVLKAVDITDICPTSMYRVVIKYTRVMRGVLFQLCKYEKKDTVPFSAIHWHIFDLINLDTNALDIPPQLINEATNYGISLKDLLKTILDYACISE